MRTPRAANLALGDELLLIAVGGVPRDLAGPQSQTHLQVGTAHHHQRQEVDEDDHTHVVPGGTGSGGQGQEVRVRTLGS